MNVRDAIEIDFESGIMYSNEQAFVSYPCRFATVEFMLHDTDVLYAIADSMRKELGYLPMCQHGDGEPYDPIGWYNFYIGINDYTKTKVDSCIFFTVGSEGVADDGHGYDIDLTEEEQVEIYKVLDEQCREHIGKSCEDLLAESRKELEERIEYEKRVGSI